ncbi:uncharacterized protein N7459_006546 [Penicillium hispanicum]|uniref:uncharacterized protein n=1 Tax=Penicillium hispanicum TaxID=1080232 RepID=UPI0025419B7F|nr:uncharacterized protein N7459_006546 [Penicillium hispanicum]KAJ5577582.1 hypothetical protein N7459_006546 [Penicillium hispanicum]
MSNPDRGGSSKPQETSNTRWQFIDASKNRRSNLTQVKRHVMQEYMRQKKGCSRQSESDEEANRPQAKRGRPRKARVITKRKPTTQEESPPKSLKESPERQVSALSDEEDAPVDIEVNSDRFAGTSMTSNPAVAVAIPEVIIPGPCRSSPSQPQGYPLPYGCVDICPQGRSQVAEFNCPSYWSSAPTAPLGFTQSPRTILSAARTDPFNSLPMELDLDGQRLFDFYANDMPACSYGTHYRSTKAHNWYTSVFVPEAMKGAVAFQNTILAHAANTWAWVHNETETPDTLLHRDRSITMLRGHLHNHPRDDSDVAIISCLSAAALEDFDPRPGHKEISWLHMRAAREMIRARGGPSAFTNTRLGMLINWQDYILSGYETHGLSFFFEQIPSMATSSSEPPLLQPSPNIYSMPSPPCSPSSVPSDVTSFPEVCPNPQQSRSMSPIDEIRLQCEVFLDFLRRCEQLALYQKDNPESCDLSRHTAVQETSLLYQILSAPPGARFTASGDRKQMVARLTATMMLNAALWDYRYTPIHAGVFLNTLEESIIDSEVSMSGSVEAVLQILLACNDGCPNERPACSDGTVAPNVSENVPDFSQYSPTATSPFARPWFAGRMLKVAKRLSANSWHRVTDFLFACLTLQVQESTAFLWEADLRREILHAPLTSYVMPSLAN